MTRVFILYAVIAGLVIGVLSGGSAARLGDLRFAWAPLIVVGMVGQVLLFSTPLGDALGPAAPPPVRRLERGRPRGGLAQPGDPGPAARPARWGVEPHRDLRQRRVHAGQPGRAPGDGSAAAGGLHEQPARRRGRPRSADRPFAMPAWIPAANVFSVGDILIGVGAAIAVVAAMHGRGPLERRGSATPPRPPTDPAAVRRRTDPTGHGTPVLPAHGPRDERSCTVRHGAMFAPRGPPSRANPSRDGDAKPGIFPRKTARLPAADAGPRP